MFHLAEHDEDASALLLHLEFGLVLGIYEVYLRLVGRGDRLVLVHELGSEFYHLLLVGHLVLLKKDFRVATRQLDEVLQHYLVKSLYHVRALM